MASGACVCRTRHLVVLVVSVALLLDSMLMTIIVPIIPMLLLSIQHPQNSSTGTQASGPALPSHSAPPLGTESGVTPSSGSHLGPLLNTSRSPDQQQNHTSNSSRCLVDTVLLHRENFEVGALLAAKPVVELFVNPIVGPLTNRFGFHIPMFAGFLIMFGSTLLFAFAETYTLLSVARGLQGVGSSFSSVAGLGLLASVYPDDEERGQAMGVALGGLALGTICGPPFGTMMYEYLGKSAPYLVLAGVALLDGVLQLCILRPSQVSAVNIKGTSLFTLLRDPYILLTAGALAVSNMAMAILETTLPIWIVETMCAPEWQLGLAYLPGGIVYLFTTSLLGVLSQRMGRWLCSMLGMVMIAVSVLCIPLITSFSALIGPIAGVGFSLGLVAVSLFPVLGHLVDVRHVAVYGSVYAIGDVALCLGFSVGPLAGGALVEAVGFPLLMVFIGVINAVYAPLLVLLRNPPTRVENQALVDQEESSGHTQKVSSE